MGLSRLNQCLTAEQEKFEIFVNTILKKLAYIRRSKLIQNSLYDVCYYITDI